MKRTVGDTVSMNGVSYINSDKTPLDWTALSYTPKLAIETQGGTETMAAATITAHPTQTFTASASTDYITANDHGVKQGDQIVVANSGGALPTGLAASTRYWPINITANRFQLAEYPEGPNIDITGAGTGTHTFYVVGSWQATNAQLVTGGLASGFASLTVQRYKAWVSAFNGATQVETAPADREGFEIDVQARGH